MNLIQAPPTPPLADLRERLLRSAEEVCSRKGIYDARIEDFTRGAGVAKGTFYLYFPCREAIVHAVTADAFRELGDRCRGALATARRSRTLRTRAMVEAHLDFYIDRPGRMRILHQARGVLKFALPEWLPLSSSLEQHVTLVAGLLGLPPALPATDRRDAARLLFGAVSGAASTWAATEAGSLAALPRDVAAPLSRIVLDFVQQRLRLAKAAEFR